MSPRTMIEIAPGALSRSRGEAARALHDAGVPDDAAEALLKASGRGRHITRIRSHVDGALEQALFDEGLEGLDPEQAPMSIVALAVAMLALDAFGPDPRPWETAPKSRHRAFRRCDGIGGDGAGAVMASAHGACAVLSSRFGVATPRIVLAPEDGDIRVTISGGGHSASSLVRISPTETADCQPSGWTMHAAKLGLDRSVGLTVAAPYGYAVRIGAERTALDRGVGRNPLDYVHAFEGTASEWSAVYNRATAQKRLETTLEKWAKVIADLPPDEAQATPPCVGTDTRRPTMTRALAWIDALEMGRAEREGLAEDLALGVLAPSVLEERLRGALGQRLGRTG